MKKKDTIILILQQGSTSRERQTTWCLEVLCSWSSCWTHWNLQFSLLKKEGKHHVTSGSQPDLACLIAWGENRKAEKSCCLKSTCLCCGSTRTFWVLRFSGWGKGWHRRSRFKVWVLHLLSSLFNGISILALGICRGRIVFMVKTLQLFPEI